MATRKTTKKATKKTVRKTRDIFEIMDNDTLVRSYDVETHGKDASKLADMFATKKGYKVIKKTFNIE